MQLRKGLLVALAVMATTGAAPPTASATDIVEVVNEKNGAHCALLGIHSCRLHFTGLGTMRVDLGIFGEAHEATCNWEIRVRYSESLFKFLDSIFKTSGDANCSTVFTECNLPWSASGEEDGSTGVLQSNMTVCIDPAEGPVCEGTLAYDLVEGAGEGYATQFTNSSVGLCELDVDLTMECTVTTNACLHANHP